MHALLWPGARGHMIGMRRTLMTNMSAAGGLGRGKRVLVVDDDALGRKLASLRLREVGFEVETAASAEEALQRTMLRPPDAILSDVRMTGMDGFALRQAIRSDPRLAMIPVILLSSSIDEQQCLSPPSEPDREILLRTPDYRHAIDALVEALRDVG